MKDGYLIGLDLGTSAVKGILISTAGDVIASCEEKTDFIIDEATGHIEYDIDRYYDGICHLIRTLVESLHGSGSVLAVSMAAASGNSLLVDKACKPLTRVISWMDRRATPDNCETLARLHQEDVHEVVGWPAIPSFPLAHFSWFKEHNADAYGRTAHFAMNTDYVLYKMTGKWMMDHSTATTFYLQDQRSRSWHSPFLDILSIDTRCLPALAPSGTVAGNLIPEAAAKMGLSTDTVAVLGAFDHPSAARGTGTLEVGQLLLSCGTSWVGFYPVADRALPLSLGLLVDPFLSPDGPWGTMFSLPCIGVTVDWYVDNLIAGDCQAGKERMIRFDTLAQQVAPGANGFLLDPVVPVEDNQELAEQCRQHGPAVTARALMEGTAYQMKYKMSTLAKSGLSADTIVMVGGPSKSPIWPQILADVTGAELRLINGQHAGAYGAALLAGIGAGVYADENEAFEQTVKTVRTIRPNVDNQELYRDCYRQFCESID